jgi:acetyltransferase
MSVRNLDALLRPQSVAVIGATPRAGAIGRIVLQNIIAAGFRGQIYPVNPKHVSVLNLPAFPHVQALPAAPDLAVIASPPETVIPTVNALARLGTRAVVVITAGFGEGRDVAGSRRLTALLEAAKPHTLRIVGPNCFGLLTPAIGLNASFARGGAKPGSLAFVTQSGAMLATMLDWAAPRGIGFSAAVSLGDMADVDFGDMLDWLAVDPQTSAILLYIEAVTSPRKFMSAARAAARLKPVIVIKGGRHAAGAKAAASHTGALAGADDVYDAAFARAGVLRVTTMQEMLDTVALVAHAPAVGGDRLAIVTNGGGAGVLAVDRLLDGDGTLADLDPATVAALGAVLPATWSGGNPVDIIGDADAARYRSALDIVAADHGVDAVVTLFCPTAVADPLDVANAVSPTLHGKPILAAWLGEESVREARATLVSHGVPSFTTPDGAIEGFTNLRRYNRRREALMQVPKTSEAVARSAVREARALLDQRGDGWLAAADVRTLLRLYGIPTNESVAVASPEQAGRAAAGLGRPVALKIRSPDVIHKSDVGGVILNLSGEAAVRTAAESMQARIGAVAPRARLEGFTVETMVIRPQAQELFLGVTVDRTFGPVVAFGRGGTAVEILGDKALGLPPLNPSLALEMIAETRIGRLLRGYRGTPAADLDALVRALVALSQLVADHPTITDLDINPLLADADGLIAVDARIRVDRQSQAPMVISPYPAELEQVVRLQSGVSVLLRPLRPEDELLIETLVQGLTPEDARFRFFSPLRGLGHATAARLCQIDYDREMALIALPQSVPHQPWGVGRLHADPDNERAEFAVTVASAHQGKGLGYVLLEQLIDIARARGIGILWGQVMRDNHRMLQLCRELSFALEPAEDPSIIVCSRTP